MERYQQPADPAVAVVEWMDSLELIVHERDLDQRGQLGVVIDAALKNVERVQHHGRGRRNVAGVLDGLPRPPDVVLSPPKLSGALVFTAHAAEEALVQFSDEPQA